MGGTRSAYNILVRVAEGRGPQTEVVIQHPSGTADNTVICVIDPTGFDPLDNFRDFTIVIIERRILLKWILNKYYRKIGTECDY
jgi:hypothetical protein